MHKFVLTDEITLSHLNYLNRNYQRNRNHRVHQDEISKKLKNTIHRRRKVPLNISICIAMIFIKEPRQYSAYNTQDDLNEQYVT